MSWRALKKTAATYSPAGRSTIGAGGLNFSVRDGKRWSPAAITAKIRMTMSGKRQRKGKKRTWKRTQRSRGTEHGGTAPQGARFGQLVRLGFDVAAFAPASYQRPRLGRPSKRRSHLAAGFALRCLQRLSRPDLDTQRCAWRHNWYTRGLSSTVLSY